MERQVYGAKGKAIEELKKEYPLSLKVFDNGIGFKISYIPFTKGIQNPLEFLKGKLEFSLGIVL